MNNESPYAHRIARTQKKAPVPTNRTTPTIGVRSPDRDEAPEPIVTPEPASVSVSASVPTASPEPKPAAPETPGLRQVLIALTAFIVTTLVLLVTVVIWKLISPRRRVTRSVDASPKTGRDVPAVFEARWGRNQPLVPDRRR